MTLTLYEGLTHLLKIEEYGTRDIDSNSVYVHGIAIPLGMHETTARTGLTLAAERRGGYCPL